jgi:hypothetical protein
VFGRLVSRFFVPWAQVIIFYQFEAPESSSPSSAFNC